MKKTMKFALLVLMALMVVSSALADTWCVYTENGKPLNIRVKPSKNSKLTAKLSVGSEVDVKEITEDGVWAHVSFGRHSGYCMLSFLRQGSMRVSEELGYTLFYDAGRFDLTGGGEMDSFMWKGNTGERPACYLTLSSIRNMTVHEVMNGLVLQNGKNGAEGSVYETELGGYEALGYTNVAGTAMGDRITQFVCCPMEDGSVLMAECGLYVGAEDDPGAFLRDMLDSIEITGAADESIPEYVQCDFCGGWFEAGNVFRNHLCPASSAEGPVD